ncbi:MAG: SDR family oxidoreductase [Sphingobium sp.]|uniref:SDR family oxidoreductase n=1 Tax=Sphingobium sp. TaxID=1912891 RepID=UPI0029A1A354|nr:SDR family oxidoreductase [Sphingobium sp.]MDX3909756.1 SDR family oxidoreductase [Sphingobium sp.]
MRPKLKPLHEQVIVITGATSGNGLATAQEAVRRGASLVIAARNPEALITIERDLSAKGGRVASVVADVSDPEDVSRIAEKAIEEFGGFDSWVNNAAVGLYGRLDQVPLPDHRQTFDVNYFGTLHGCLIAAEHLRSRPSGAIINIGSILGDRTIVQQGPYSATKHAVQALTDTLRMELEREGANISVTLVKPGGCGTPYPEHARNYMDQPPRIPQPLYHPSIIADAILFACETPRRVMYIGGGGVASSLIGQIAPRLTDKVMEAIGTRMQQKPGDPGDPAMRDNLYAYRADSRVTGTQRMWLRKTSAAVAAQKLPGAAWVGAAVGLGLMAFARRGLKQRS